VHTIRHGRVERFIVDGLDAVTTIRAIVSDTGDGVWIAGVYGTVWHVRPSGVEVWDTARGLSPSMINSMLRTRDGDLWIGTDGGGLARISQDRITRLDTRDGLINDFAHVAIEDPAVEPGTLGDDPSATGI
jgi:ligand-binding sensor domain-containing protein